MQRTRFFTLSRCTALTMAVLLLLVLPVAGASAKPKPSGGDSGTSAHPSGNDRYVEPGGSGTQGSAPSDPDDDDRGPERSAGQSDKPGDDGGVDQTDQDGNNGCGNDQDFEDDNEGLCGPAAAASKEKPDKGEKPDVAEKDKDKGGSGGATVRPVFGGDRPRPPGHGVTDGAPRRGGLVAAVSGERAVDGVPAAVPGERGAVAGVQQALAATGVPGVLGLVAFLLLAAGATAVRVGRRATN